MTEEPGVSINNDSKEQTLRQEEIERLKVLAETWKNLSIIHYELSTSIGIENPEKGVSGYAASCYMGCVAGLEKEIKKLEGYCLPTNS